jgi:hypothetical protein
MKTRLLVVVGGARSAEDGVLHLRSEHRDGGEELEALRLLGWFGWFGWVGCFVGFGWCGYRRGGLRGPRSTEWSHATTSTSTHDTDRQTHYPTTMTMPTHTHESPPATPPPPLQIKKQKKTSKHTHTHTHLLRDGDEDVARGARHAEAARDERRQKGLLSCFWFFLIFRGGDGGGGIMWMVACRVYRPIHPLIPLDGTTTTTPPR